MGVDTMHKGLMRIVLTLILLFVPGYQAAFAATSGDRLQMVAPEFVFFGLSPLKQGENPVAAVNPQKNLELAKGPINPDPPVVTPPVNDGKDRQTSSDTSEATSGSDKLFLRYTVKPGDSLFSIAHQLNTDVSTLLAINSIADPGLIHPGQVLQIPINGADLPQAVSGQVSTVITATLTAYTAGPESTGKRPGDPGYGITATGTTVMDGRTIAVDPERIPLGSKVYIEGIGFRVAEDTGGAIKGNRIDVYMSNLQDAVQFGVKRGVKVYVLSTPKDKSL
jgi:3D (Asp-Asp-Asp) domain-containing protein